MKQKKVIIFTSIIISIILITSFIAWYIISKKNINLLNGEFNVVIYQYYTDDDNKLKDPIIIYKEKFTKDLTYDKKIYALNHQNDNDYNHIIIKDGVIKVTEADCFNEICMKTKIDINNDKINLFDPNSCTIECKPHGLKITLEEIK